MRVFARDSMETHTIFRVRTHRAARVGLAIAMKPLQISFFFFFIPILIEKKFVETRKRGGETVRWVEQISEEKLYCENYRQIIPRSWILFEIASPFRILFIYFRMIILRVYIS